MDKEAQEKMARELPENRWVGIIEQHKAIGIDPQTAINRMHGYKEAQQDMIKAGYRKLPKDKPPLVYHKENIYCASRCHRTQREADIKHYEG